jgi:hypothetical protein
MDTLFTQEWFIQALYEHLLKIPTPKRRNQTFYELQYERYEQLCTLFMVNRKCWEVGHKYSKFQIVAHDDSNMRVIENSYIADTYNKMVADLPRILKENDYHNEICLWHMAISAYRLYTSVDNRVHGVKKYLDSAYLFGDCTHCMTDDDNENNDNDNVNVIKIL